MKRDRKLYGFRHADTAERVAAIAIAREMGDMTELEAWRRYVKGEELPQFFHDFAENCGEVAEEFVEEVLERERITREAAAADVKSRILRSASETPATK
jgi:hypothetical protein